MYHLEQMVDLSYNHPSIIMWGFLNEGDSSIPEAEEIYTCLIHLLRQKDTSRLITYATDKLLKDLFISLVDVISINIYPGWYADDPDSYRPLQEISKKLSEFKENLVQRGYSQTPVLISEIGAGAIYGWRDPLNGPWTEVYQADYLETACKVILGSERWLGVSIWQFCDCRTYPTSRSLWRPRGFNNKGIVDEYRRPKLAFQRVKELFTSTFPSTSRNQS